MLNSYIITVTIFIFYGFSQKIHLLINDYIFKVSIHNIEALIFLFICVSILALCCHDK